MTRLWERIRDWVLLGSLLMVSVVTLLTANDPMYRGLRARSLEVTSSVETLFAGIGRYFRALDENEELRERNVLLNNEVAQMREALSENRQFEAMLGLRDSVTTDLVAARVISKDITRERNLIVLDVGRRHGIEEGMAVVDERGIVGKTLLVTDNFTQVMTFQNTDFYVPARILPSGSDGMIRWDGERFGTLLMELVERTAPVQIGDRVVAGPSDIFHSSTPIGVIDTVMVPPGAPTLAIYVRPFSRIGDLTHVFVDRSRPVSSQIPFNP